MVWCHSANVKIADWLFLPVKDPENMEKALYDLGLEDKKTEDLTHDEKLKCLRVSEQFKALAVMPDLRSWLDIIASCR